MITLHLSGGLGNQMFQYAAAMALAHRHKTELILDITEFSRYNLRAYMLDVFQIPGSVKTITSKPSFLPARIKNMLPVSNLYTEPHFHFDPAFFNAHGNQTLKGYFQSEKYFITIQDIIRQHFTLKNPLSQESIAIKRAIDSSKTSVSIHVRRGDYVSDSKTLATHGVMPIEYYKQAIARMKEEKGEEIRFFIFSDDPDYIKTEFDFCPNKYIVTGNANASHEDMHLMSLCQHNIIANSSFSWWGAWLNSNPQKKIIAPKAWFSEKTLKTKTTKDLIPKEWIQI